MSDSVKIKDENNDHKYFCILQNVLSRIGLTAFERSVYWAIKECCGEHGSCTKSHPKLAEMAGLSKRSLIRTLESLAQPNKILGKSLIKIIHRVNECGDRDTNEIIIVDIWNDNIRVCQYRGSATQTPPHAKETLGIATQTVGVVPHRHQGSATQAYKQEPFIKTPLNKTTTSDVVDFFDCLKNEQRLTDKEKLSLMKSSTEERIMLALEYSKHEQPKTTLIQMLMWHCLEKEAPKIPGKKKKSFKQYIKDNFKNNGVYNYATCYIDEKGINLHRGSQNLASFSDPSFENVFREICKRLEIKLDQ